MAKLGPIHPATLQSVNNLAKAYQAAGKPDLALPHLEQMLANQKTKFGPDHFDTLITPKVVMSQSRDCRVGRIVPIFLRRAELQRTTTTPNND